MMKTVRLITTVLIMAVLVCICASGSAANFQIDSYSSNGIELIRAYSTKQVSNYYTVTFEVKNNNLYTIDSTSSIQIKGYTNSGNVEKTFTLFLQTLEPGETGVCTYVFIPKTVTRFEMEEAIIHIPRANWGWKEIRGKTYYFDYNGPKVGTVTLRDSNGLTGNYYFDKNGVMQKGLFSINGVLYYYGEDGKRVTGWQTIDGDKYYFNPNALTGYQRLRNETEPSFFDDYLFDASGKLIELITSVNLDDVQIHVGETIQNQYWGKTYLTELVSYNPEIATGKIVNISFHPDSKMYDAVFEFSGFLEGETMIRLVGSSGRDHGNLKIKVLPVQGTDSSSNNDMSKINSFVERCYSLILGRAADEGGLRMWVNQLASGSSNAATIISNFLGSQEYTDKSKTGSETVDILYNTMLNRPADEAGKEYWTSILASAGDNSAVINGFCGSQEFLGLCAEYGIEAGSVATGGQQTGTGLEGFVSRCYSEALGRGSDEGGLSYWCNILQNKEQTPQQVAAGFIFSTEMNAAEKIKNDPDALLDSLYKLYLGREADEGGKAYWKQRIADGLSLEELNAGFAYSAEFSDIVTSYGLE